MKKTIATVIFIMFAFMAFSQSSKAYYKMLKNMYAYSVPVIEADELLPKLDNSSGLILLDTREEAEYEVSHLQNARFVGYDSFTMESIHNYSTEDTIVVYCSVGYRSERIGEQLIKAGYQHVFNLYGGLFEWVNKDYPMVKSSGEATKEVHAYDKEWGRWLKNGEKVYGRK